MAPRHVAGGKLYALTFAIAVATGRAHRVPVLVAHHVIYRLYCKLQSLEVEDDMAKRERVVRQVTVS